MDASQKDYRLAAVVFADIHGFSGMLQSSEENALELLEFHNRLIFDFAKKHGGSVIKTMGDAVLIEFKNTANAVKYSVAIQDTLFDYNTDRSADGRLLLRIGIHLGDIWFFENDAMGEGINVASRLKSISSPGRICISKDVYNQIDGKLDLKIMALGRTKLTGSNRELQTYEIITRFSETESARRTMPERNAGQSSEDITKTIVDRIKFEGKRLPLGDLEEFFPGASEKVRKVLGKLTDKGILTRIERNNGDLEFGISDFKFLQSYGPRPGGPRSSRPVPSYPSPTHGKPKQETNNNMHHDRESETEIARTDELEQEMAKSTSFPIHLATYLAVNGLLFMIYYLTTPGGHPWFLYPAGAWGIGLITHFTNSISHRRHRKELRSKLSKEQKKILKRIHSAENGFRGHLSAFAGVIGFLFMIYFTATPSASLPWPLIPAGAWDVGLFLHGIAHFVRKGFLLGKLKQTGLKGRRTLGTTAENRTSHELGEYDGLIQEAVRIKESIFRTMNSSKQLRSEWKADIEPLLNNFITQISDLNGKDQELSRIMASIREDDIDQEIVLLRRKQADATADYLKAEYEKSIKQVGKQKESYEDLGNQKEMIELRLKSSVTSLKKLQIDLARMKGFSATEEQYALTSLKDKSEELSHYLDDLKSGYSELES